MNNFGTAIILAGGKSSRMGFDKQFLNLKGRRLIDIIIEQLKEEFQEIIILTNKPEEYKNYPCKVLTDEIESIGPLAGIYTGLRAAIFQYTFITACDMPHISMDYIKYMKEIIEKYSVDICITKIGKYMEPFHGFYSKGIIEDLERHIKNGKRDIKSLIEGSNTYYIEENIVREYSPDLKIFKNLNTQEDLRNYSNSILE